MPRLEDVLTSWAKRPSDSEAERIERTKRHITNAISNSSDGRLKNAKVFAKGSVRMRTNIRKTSDIDICVQADGLFFSDYPEETTDSDFGVTTVDYTFDDFRNSVESALTSYFGSADVDKSGNVAIRVRENDSGSRIDADVVPAFEHRRFISTSRPDSYHSGIELRTKNTPSKRIVNWPHHNYDNSLSKHNNTSRRYRKMVRILKRAREDMKAKGITAADNGASFLIESLLWNVPNGNYGYAMLTDDFTNILGYLLNTLDSDEAVKEWGEVNELKYLFNPHQKWNRAGAYSFVSAVNRHMGSV